VQKVDCVIANHDLVLVDLALGGGVILPDPADTIYIFDEAHHLPDKTNQHFSASTRLRSTLVWIDSSLKTLARLSADTRLPENTVIDRECAELDRLLKVAAESLGNAVVQFEALYSAHMLQQEQNPGRADDAGTLTFDLGVVP